MDNRSFSVLVYAAKSDRRFTADEIVEVVGCEFVEETVNHLLNLHLIACVDNENELFLDPIYRITPHGHAVLKEQRQKNVTRRIAIWGAITGTISLLAELVLLFLR